MKLSKVFRSGSNSTRTSTSLCKVASSRTNEPKIPIFLTPNSGILD